MASSFGYYVYLVRAAKPFNTGQLYRLNEVGDARDDLLPALRQQIKNLGLGYHSQTSTAEGYRIKERTIQGRTLWIRINRGPEGVPGETYDRDSDKSVETTDRIALLSGIRAMFVLPADSYFGLLFVEKVGARNLKELLNDIACRTAGQASGAQIRLESFAEIGDWERELEGMSALRVSESLVLRSSGDDASSVDDTVIHISADGALVRRATDRVKDIFFGRIRRRDERMDVLTRSSQLGEERRAAEEDGVTFQSEREYQAELQLLRDLNQADEYEPELAAVVSEVVPVDREHANHKRFDVAMGDDKPRRSIAIEGNMIPMFKYELGGRLTDGGLRNTWVAHAERILTRRGVTLPNGWADSSVAGKPKKAKT